MKVLLINPPYARLRGSGQGAYFPLGLGYLAGVLSQAGVETLIYSAENCGPGEPLPKSGMREVFHLRSQGYRNEQRALRDSDHMVWAEIRDVLETTRPDLVGITALSVQFGAAAKTAEIVKAWKTQTPVVLGGHHPTHLPESALKQAPHVDVLVLGEGELTFLELCRAYSEQKRPDFSQIRGLAYRENGRVAFSMRRPLIENLDQIPFPSKNLVVFPERYHPLHYTAIIMGRGCPWRCRFCSSQRFWQRRTRLRSPENTLNEISRLISDYHLTDVMFWDDAFTVNRQSILAFCRLAERSRTRFSFQTATRADLIDGEIVSALKKAGCRKLTLGVETGSPRVSRMIRKDLDFNALKKAASIIRGQGISLGAFFMAGFPKETPADLQMTFDLIKEMRADEVAFNIFDPMPGSSLYDECIELGLVRADADWRDFPLWPDAHYVTEMSPATFDRMARAIGEFIFKRNEGVLGKMRSNLPLLRHHPRAFFKRAVRRVTASFWNNR